ncbi:MAG: hypothetical protein AB1490_26340 [Pseudomonadota bacterium]
MSNLIFTLLSCRPPKCRAREHAAIYTLEYGNTATGMSDLIRILLEKLLGRAQDRLHSMPPRDWSEAGWQDRAGRLLLIAVALALVIAVLWLLLR